MRRERALLLLIVALFVGSITASIAQRVPFENDESVYAIQARAWATGGPTTGIGLQRAPLLPAIGSILYETGARSEWPFRLTGLVFGTSAVILVWALGRAIAGPAAGLIGAALFASAPSIQQRSAQFLTDVPATAFLLALALVLWRNRERAGPSLLLAAPIAAAAFYMRYASILPIGLLAVVAVVLWHRSLLRDKRLAIGTIVLFAALLIPHMVRAMDATGRPWGLVTHTAKFAGRRYIGDGLVRYIGWWPHTLAGPVAGLAMVVGIGFALARRSRSTAFLVIPAVLDIVLIGLTEHGEPRLIFFPVALLCIAGAIALTNVERARNATAVVLAGALLAGGAFTISHTATTRARRMPPKLVGHVVAARAHHPCTVNAVEIAETTWYTVCSTYYFGARPADFAVFYAGGGVRLNIQPREAPPGSTEIGSPRYRGLVVATVYALRGP